MSITAQCKRCKTKHFCVDLKFWVLGGERDYFFFVYVLALSSIMLKCCNLKFFKNCIFLHKRRSVSSQSTEIIKQYTKTNSYSLKNFNLLWLQSNFETWNTGNATTIGLVFLTARGGPPNHFPTLGYESSSNSGSPNQKEKL